MPRRLEIYGPFLWEAAGDVLYLRLAKSKHKNYDDFVTNLNRIEFNQPKR